jgi:hypothetical protein
MPVSCSSDVFTLAEATATSLKTLIDNGDLAWTKPDVNPYPDNVLEARLKPFVDHIYVTLTHLGVPAE